MEKTNLEIIVDELKKGKMKSIDLESKTSIPKTTLFRSIKALLDDKIIGKNKDSEYYYIQPTPSIKDIYDVLYIIHQQKLMDNKYRKMKTESKVDDLLISYINNPILLKGHIADYNFNSLIDNITRAINMIKQSI